jgi:hypothetical protein
MGLAVLKMTAGEVFSGKPVRAMGGTKRGCSHNSSSVQTDSTMHGGMGFICST